MIQIALTPEQFAAKAAQMEAEEGVTLTGKSGTISKRGVTAQWSYDGRTLSVDITHKPLLVKLSYCENTLRDWLATPPAQS